MDEKTRVVQLMEKIAPMRCHEDVDVREAFTRVEIASLRRDERAHLDAMAKAAWARKRALGDQLAEAKRRVEDLERMVRADAKLIDRIESQMTEPVSMSDALGALRRAIETDAYRRVEAQLALALLDLQAALEEDGVPVCETCAGVGKIIKDRKVVDCRECLRSRNSCGCIHGPVFHMCKECVHLELSGEEYPCNGCINCRRGDVCFFERNEP